MLNKNCFIISLILLSIFSCTQPALCAGAGRGSLIRAKSAGEAVNVKSQLVRAMSVGTNKFGPVRPEEELKQRKNSFRSEYIAAASLEHNSSSGIDCANLLSSVNINILTLSETMGVNLSLTTFELEDAINLWKNIQKEVPKQWFNVAYRQNVPTERRLSNLIWKLVLALDDMDDFYISGDLARSMDSFIKNSPDSPKMQKSKEILQSIRKAISLMREFCHDREKLLRRSNIEETVSIFYDIKDSIIERGKGRLLIDDSRLTLDTAVAMSSARLFSLINNLVVNALRETKGRVYLYIYTDEATGELVIKVSDEGEGISEEYFEKRENGLIRLFDVEERNGRVPIGLAEVWDIVAISNGTILVETEVGKGSSFTIRLPVTVGALAAGAPGVVTQDLAPYKPDIEQDL